MSTREQFQAAVEELDLGNLDTTHRLGKLLKLAAQSASVGTVAPDDVGQDSALPPLTDSIDNTTARADDRKMNDLSRQEVDAKLAASEAKVDARLANFDTSIRTGFAELRTEFAGIRTDMAKQSGDMRTEMADLRAEMHKGTVDIIKWVIGFGIASLGAIFAFGRMSEKAPAQAAAQPAPIVIYSQPAPPPEAPQPPTK